MKGLAEGYEIRPGRPDDIAAVAALDATYEVAVHGSAYMDEVWVREEWTRPRFDPVVDSWLATAGDEVVGYGLVYDEEPHVLVESLARVHPDHWGRGIGTALVERMEARANEHVAHARDGSIRLLNDVTSKDDAAHALLEASGYVLDRFFWHMYLDLAGQLSEWAAPPGVGIRGFERATDSEAVHAVMEEAFEGHYQHVPMSSVEWEADLDKDSFDPGLWLVAVEAGSIVGALSGRTLMAEGWVSDLGVVRSARGRGIGAALLAESFQIFKQRGFGTVALNVDAANETGATALYERVGMRVRRQWDLFLKILRGTGKES